MSNILQQNFLKKLTTTKPGKRGNTLSLEMRAWKRDDGFWQTADGKTRLKDWSDLVYVASGENQYPRSRNVKEAASATQENSDDVSCPNMEQTSL